MLFPRYNDGQLTNVNSCSPDLSKWIKQHSFRRFMRNRLGAIECLEEAIDQIGGYHKNLLGGNMEWTKAQKLLENE